MNCSLTLAVILYLVPLSLLSADEANQRIDLVEVNSVEDVHALTMQDRSVSVSYQPSTFSAIMKELSLSPFVRHLTLSLPNSSGVKDDALEVLQKFQSLESLTLNDARDWKSPKTFEIIGSMQHLKRLELQFL